MSTKSMLTAGFAPAVTLLCVGAHGQASDSVDDERPEIERCAMTENLIDLAVFGDRHVYLRTRGNNHYLLNLEQCEDLHRAYLRNEVQLVPYGRQVCQNDGSYIAYLKTGRRRHCAIVHVERVSNRTEARELAADYPAIVTTESIELEAESEPGRSR